MFLFSQLIEPVLYNIFNEFLEDINEDTLPNEATGFKDTEIWKRMYDFQKDAVIGAINKLERYNGCILADSVGLGKTFTALGIIKYYELRNKTILVLCPKKIGDNWNTYIQPLTNNILSKDRFNYRLLYHTDLSRDSGTSNGIPLDRVNWENFDLLVIDESHNFRNNVARKEHQTRYQRLLNKVIRSGVNTKVLMLSATPVNNRFNDLKNQLALAYEGDPDKINAKLSTTRNITEIFKRAQTVFNEWSKIPATERTRKRLKERLDYDFFELLDSVTIARSRKHIKKYYDMQEIGSFPKREKPISYFIQLTKREDVIKLEDIHDSLSLLNLSLYTPFKYILPSKRRLYEQMYNTIVKEGKSSFSQYDREKSLQGLMRINLLKRLESSVYSFRKTIQKITDKIQTLLDKIETYRKYPGNTLSIEELADDINEEELEQMDTDDFIGQKVKISLKDTDTISWQRDLLTDLELLKHLYTEVSKITPEHDEKLETLKQLIAQKQAIPLNPGNKKILIFTAFADTATYLYDNISEFAKNNYHIETAKIVGTDQNQNTLKLKNEFNTILMNFAPMAKERNLLAPNMKTDIDILIGTDCISEGQNLQDCDFLVNYDIHWNPVRIIQRFGRIDRIGSKNEHIQLVNFWPDMTMEEYINLKSRVERRMTITDMTATGEENLLSEEKEDLEYREIQLKRLKEEVIELEDINNGVSITDLGLTEFRMDLIHYIHHNESPETLPNGLHTIVESDRGEGIIPGVIFVLKNINDDINIDNQNRLHPFYIAYISDQAELIISHIEVKETLDTIRKLCKGNTEPLKEKCEQFNRETEDGRKMEKYSTLLEETIKSIIQVKEETDINSLFTTGGTTALKNTIKGLEDFELIAFLVIK
ncbi:MAG: helicase-related protein [Thermotogota bacterium]|nr:helicase-related protein [Thermotogota bacterium]